MSQNSGWLMLLNSTRINEHWGTHFDAQFRSQDNWDGIRHVLIRPGVTYFVNANQSATLGYLFTETYTKFPDRADNTLTEHRLWEQYVIKHKLGGAGLSHRFRLEQRFIERYANEQLFAQRLRYFARAVLPLGEADQGFNQGFFAALQDELFFNIQGKGELNGKMFDQNRAYVAFGYRVSKGMDIEAGYMNQHISGATNKTSNHIVQLAIYTHF